MLRDRPDQRHGRQHRHPQDHRWRRRIGPWPPPPHGLTDGTAYRIEVRVINGRIEVYLNGSNSAVTTYTIPSTDTYLVYDGFGFAGVTDGAIVNTLELCQLVAERSAATEVLCVVGGGELWCSTDGDNLFRIAPRAFNPDVSVSMAAFEQKMYIVDGSVCKVFNPTDLTLIPLRPHGRKSARRRGQLGGLVRCDGPEAHIGRLFFAGGKSDPQNIIATAVNDARRPRYRLRPARRGVCAQRGQYRQDR